MTTNVQGRSQTLRAAIVAVLATAALSQVPMRKAQAACSDTINGVITCTGDLSGGVNASQPGDPNDFNDKTTTTLRVESVTTPIAPAPLVNGVRIEERRPFARDGDPEMQDVTVHLTGTAGQPLTISTTGNILFPTAAVSLVTTTGEASDGADATSGFLCAGSDSAEVGHDGLDGNRLIANVSNVSIVTLNGAGIRLENQANEGHAAMAGQGFALLTPLLWKGDVASGRLCVPFADRVSVRGWAYWLAYPRERRMVPKVKRFREWLLAEMRQALEEYDGGWTSQGRVPEAIQQAAQS